MFKSPTPANENARSTAIDMLQKLVVNGIALSLAAQDAHWNTKGPTFGPLHALFGDVYAFAQSAVDRIAERIVTLGGIANGMAALGMKSDLAGIVSGDLDGIALCGRLFDLLTAYIAMVDETYRAVESLRLTADANALQDVVEGLEKLAWQLSKHTEQT